MIVLTGQSGLERLIKQTAQLLRVPFSRIYMIFYISTKFAHGIKSLLIPSTQLSSHIMINKIQVHNLQSVTIRLQNLMLSKTKMSYQKYNIIFNTVKNNHLSICLMKQLLLKMETYIE